MKKVDDFKYSKANGLRGFRKQVWMGEGEVSVVIYGKKMFCKNEKKCAGA